MKESWLLLSCYIILLLGLGSNSVKGVDVPAEDTRERPEETLEHVKYVVVRRHTAVNQIADVVIQPAATISTWPITTTGAKRQEQCDCGKSHALNDENTHLKSQSSTMSVSLQSLSSASQAASQAMVQAQQNLTSSLQSASAAIRAAEEAASKQLTLARSQYDDAVAKEQARANNAISSALSSADSSVSAAMSSASSRVASALDGVKAVQASATADVQQQAFRNSVSMQILTAILATVLPVAVITASAATWLIMRCRGRRNINSMYTLDKEYQAGRSGWLRPKQGSVQEKPITAKEKKEKDKEREKDKDKQKEKEKEKPMSPKPPPPPKQTDGAPRSPSLPTPPARQTPPESPILKQPPRKLTKQNLNKDKVNSIDSGPIFWDIRDPNERPGNHATFSGGTASSWWTRISSVNEILGGPSRLRHTPSPTKTRMKSPTGSEGNKRGTWQSEDLAMVEDMIAVAGQI